MNRKRNSWLKRIVVVLILSIFIYVGVVLYFAWHGVPVPDSLNYTFLPGIIAQLGITGLITKKTKEVEKEVEIAHITRKGFDNFENIL